ncbi:MAG TPA: RIP metalloprotease [Candidatus Paceibacterota bacterium]|nr:RIP metalloprotease [Candidatus Paceibacterota bacterium]
MTILIFIAVLFVTVVVHEWGHFIVAKKSGMLVEEFGFGLPPRLIGWKRGETVYSLNALPIGGFVKIAGESSEATAAPKERQFATKPWYTKSAVLIAGVLCNLLLGFFLFVVADMVGLPGVTPHGIPTVIEVVSGSPTATAGISVGDTVASVAVGDAAVPVIDTDHLRAAIAHASGQSVVITYVHQGVVARATLSPVATEDGPMIGIAVESIGTIKESFVHALGIAWGQSLNAVKAVVGALALLIEGLFRGHPSTQNLVGPVGIAKEIGSAAQFGFTYVLAFAASISLNLAVLNIFPFPALDGGRLMVVWGEAITHRKFSPTVVGMVHAAGFLLLIGLMVALTISDIKRTL